MPAFHLFMRQNPELTQTSGDGLLTEIDSLAGQMFHSWILCFSAAKKFVLEQKKICANALEYLLKYYNTVWQIKWKVLVIPRAYLSRTGLHDTVSPSTVHTTEYTVELQANSNSYKHE